MLAGAPCRHLLTVPVLAALVSASCSQKPPQRLPAWGHAAPGGRFDPVLGLPEAIVEDRTGIEMILVRPGTFVMGDVGDDFPREDSLPEHRVEITRPFYLGKYEVTERQYRALCGQPEGGDARLPACGMTWHEAYDAAHKGGFRLPTEAEWEYACKAGSGLHRYGRLDKIAWYERNSGSANEERRHPVGEKLSNDWGFFDMLGNVDEWCADSWKPDAYAGLEEKTTKDPFWEDDHCKDRVLRGGSYRLPSECIAAGFRGYADAYLYNDENGFRVARDP